MSHPAQSSVGPSDGPVHESSLFRADLSTEGADAESTGSALVSLEATASLRLPSTLSTPAPGARGRGTRAQRQAQVQAMGRTLGNRYTAAQIQRNARAPSVSGETGIFAAQVRGAERHSGALAGQVDGQVDPAPHLAAREKFPSPSVHAAEAAVEAPAEAAVEAPFLHTRARVSRHARGPRVARQRGPKVQRFEAQHHEHVERGALTEAGPGGQAGFSDAEASATYFGNWSRDLSQAFVNNPVLNALGNEVMFEILNALAISKFGRELSPRDFGVYSPREHIDNPAGQVNADLLNEQQRRIMGMPEDQQPQTPQEDISSEAIGKLLAVNDAGLPAYLGRSIQFIEEELTQCANLGRNQDGLMHLGNGLHTVEDLFAHSNYIEIGVNTLIQEGSLQLNLDEETQERMEAGRSPVETLSGQTAGSTGPDGKAKPGRPILTTGSFVTADTMISISEALTAFLNDINPFSPSNPERSQQTIKMLLGRYERQSASGQAGNIVRSFLQHLGPMLTEKVAGALEQMIAGDPAGGQAEGQGGVQRRVQRGLWDDVVSGARGLAGRAVGGLVRGAGSLMQADWVQELVGNAANSYGQLPLTSIYEFILDQQSELKAFFEDLDRRLTDVPGYTTLKNFLKEQWKALKETLKPLITAALRFFGELVQVAFAETQVSATNLQAQIRQQINSNVKDPRARDQLANATPQQQMAMLQNPEWCRAAQVEPTDLERLRQMVSAPEYVRAGPSHSQIAKDHADSPFFGVAAALAGKADQRVRDLMMAVWESEGKNTSSLPQNYAGEIPPELAARRAPPGTPEHELTPDQKEAEEAAMKASPHYRELKRREEGEALLRTGSIEEGEEGHGAEEAVAGLIRGIARLATEVQHLPETMVSAADRLETAMPELARELRELAAQIPAGLDGLEERLEHAHTSEELRALENELRALMRAKRALVGVSQRVLTAAASALEALDPAMPAVADGLRALAPEVARWCPLVASQLNLLADWAKAQREHRVVGEDQQQALANLAPVQTEAWDAELAASHAGAAPGQAMSAERQALFTAIRREIFVHPYDHDWWKPVILEWFNKPENKERLEAYIKARNGGDMHHHH